MRIPIAPFLLQMKYNSNSEMILFNTLPFVDFPIKRSLLIAAAVFSVALQHQVCLCQSSLNNTP